jgi:hypothetical protein
MQAAKCCHDTSRHRNSEPGIATASQMSNLKTISLIAAEIDKLRADVKADRDADRIATSENIKQLQQRIAKLEQSSLGGGEPP